MLIIRLMYGWQANRKGGKVVMRRELGWSLILMGILIFLANGILLVVILWPSTIKTASIALSEGWRMQKMPTSLSQRDWVFHE